MKIMLIDRDRESADQIEQACAKMDNIDLTIAPTKNKALEILGETQYDAIFFDPAPQNDEMRAFIIGVRRTTKTYTPIVILSHQMSLEEIQKDGANDYIHKPFSIDLFKNKLNGLEKLSQFSQQLRTETTDFPSKDGIISKAAFQQVFESCLDRADRYGEETYLIFVKINNIAEIRAQYGEDAAAEICNNLKNSTMKIRRLSDVAGRTAQHEICLMLVRPKTAAEPKMAVERFADTMAEYIEFISTDTIKATLNVNMMAIPTGVISFSKDLA